MINDAKDEKHIETYEIEVDKENKRIGYKEQDGISYTTVYGYKTMFLHI